MIKITESAEKYLTDLYTAEGQVPRLAIGGGGCSGFQYEWTMVNEADIDPTQDELLTMNTGAKLALDGMSLMYLYGATINYKTSIAGSTLEIDNPQATGGCGCGESVSFGEPMYDPYTSGMYDESMFIDIADITDK